MSDLVAITIVGVYTLVYIVVFIIQKSQIDKIKEVNNSIRTFFDIFKIDEVKKYVALKEESSKLEATKFVLDDERVRNAANAAMDNVEDQLIEIYRQEKGRELWELIYFALNILHQQPKESQQKLLDTQLPLTKRFLGEMLEDELVFPADRK